MERRILFLISILTASNLILSGQDSVSIKPWAISLSYAPKFEIWRPLNPTNLIYFKSIELSVNKKISQHFSLGFGINYQNLKKMITPLSLTGMGLIKTSFTIIHILISQFR